MDTTCKVSNEIKWGEKDMVILQQAPEVMTANSLLGGAPATVVCGNQVQVPSCKRPS